MIRLLATSICPKKLQAARECAIREAHGFLMFDARSRCYQLLLGRARMPVGDELEEERRRLKAGGCCGGGSAVDVGSDGLPSDQVGLNQDQAPKG